MTVRIGGHAASQAAARGIDIKDVYEVAVERLAIEKVNPETTEVAIKVGFAENGWQGGSNGDVVWAIVRFGQIVTTMFRRATQPSTPEALRVQVVIA